MALQELEKGFEDIKSKRKNGELNSKEFYHALLTLLGDYANGLDLETISEEKAKRNSAILLTFLKSILKLKD
jgi:hypothetical protein